MLETSVKVNGAIVQIIAMSLPLGLNLFVVSGVTGTPVMAISRHAVSFVITLLAVVMLLMFVPAISTWLL